MVVELCNDEDDDCDCPRDASGDSNGDGTICSYVRTSTSTRTSRSRGRAATTAASASASARASTSAPRIHFGVVCNAPDIDPTGRTEVCGNGLDDDCDGLVDEGCPGELCNGLDDDGDGAIDETFPLKGQDCDNGLLGQCHAMGVYRCRADCLGVECYETNPVESENETCNCLDDNCNGALDEGMLEFVLLRRPEHPGHRHLPLGHQDLHLDQHPDLHARPLGLLHRRAAARAGRRESAMGSTITATARPTRA